MRVDVVTIFPEYLTPLGLSLVGKARQAGLLDIRTHDLRDWAQDRHRTVDDTPAGGGPGMVMRPDIWGAALDAVLADDGAPTLLLVPTPAGERFSQGFAHDLAATLEAGTRLVIACGRYEGIDSRVAEHYASVPGVTVREVSIGDYVLGGGEVAALVVIEAVARLLPGVIGNAESLVEESHGLAGLLEGPVYTRPLTWHGLEVPAVLRSGDHARIARWRRDRALDRTVERRPDLLARLGPGQLDRADRAVLARHGLLATPNGLRPLTIRPARPDDAAALAEVAAATFPLACPPGTEPADIEAFVREHLSPEAFAGHLADPGCAILLAELGPVESDGGTGSGAGEGADAGERSDGGEDSGPSGPVLGYTLARLPMHPEDAPGDPDVAAVVPQRPIAELSKCYVRAEYHGSGLADALLAAAHADLAGRTVHGVPLAAVWLGTNRGNRRGRRFYTRAGYRVVGARRFRVGAVLHHDVVMVRPLGAEDAAGR